MTAAEPPAPGSTSGLSIPLLAILSIGLAALPLLIHLLTFSNVVPENTGGYELMLLAWNGIPLIWPISIVFGIITVVRTRRWWKVTGIIAIVLPVVEAVIVVVYAVFLISEI